MQRSALKKEILFVAILLFIVAGLPLGIRGYDSRQWSRKVPDGARVFTLTGSARHGWVLGEIKAHDMLKQIKPADHLSQPPVIRVRLNDKVVLKLRSSDVTHGFSLKAFGIYIADGIAPGRTTVVSFTADKAGTFIFSCNVYCGDIHQHMQGTLQVSA